MHGVVDSVCLSRLFAWAMIDGSHFALFRLHSHCKPLLARKPSVLMKVQTNGFSIPNGDARHWTLMANQCIGSFRPRC